MHSSETIVFRAGEGSALFQGVSITHQATQPKNDKIKQTIRGFSHTMKKLPSLIALHTCLCTQCRCLQTLLLFFSVFAKSNLLSVPGVNYYNQTKILFDSNCSVHKNPNILLTSPHTHTLNPPLANTHSWTHTHLQITLFCRGTMFPSVFQLGMWIQIQKMFIQLASYLQNSSTKGWA